MDGHAQCLKHLGGKFKECVMAVVEEGQIKGSVWGFHNGETVFEFHSGGKWRQSEYNGLMEKA